MINININAQNILLAVAVIIIMLIMVDVYTEGFVTSIVGFPQMGSSHKAFDKCGNVLPRHGYQTCKPDPYGILLPSVPQMYAGRTPIALCEKDCEGLEGIEHQPILRLYYHPCCGQLMPFWQEWASLRLELPPNYAIVEEIDLSNTSMDFDKRFLPMIIKIKNGKATVYTGSHKVQYMKRWFLE